MIDEQETRLQFGYYSESLSEGSNKEVYAICKECGYTRIMKFYVYVEIQGRCMSCAQSGKSNPNYGKKHSPKTCIKMSKNHRDVSGKNNPRWKGGKKLARARANTKRRQLFGFIRHNIPHEHFHGHHIDFNHIIFIPKELHMSISHSVINDINMDLINNVVCDWYLEFQGV